MQLLHTTHLDSHVYLDALAIRKTVFIDEQGIPEDIEHDHLDAVCHHVVLYDEATALATARLYPLNEQVWKIQRVAVLAPYRHNKLGQKILRGIETIAHDAHVTTLQLSAQQQTQPFYERLGFTTNGNPSVEAGIVHVPMQKEV